MPHDQEPPGFFAHTLPDQPQDKWQVLRDHLEGVARRAAAFSGAFGAEAWGRIAGLWHDIGKYSDAFQSYLRTSSSPDSHEAEAAMGTDHSTAGAQHAVSEFGLLGHLLAFPIAGHHSGLLDAIGDGACLESRLSKEVEPWAETPGSLLDQARPDPPPFVRDALGRHDAFSVAFFVRMVFSCLVDADFLDTEAFMDSGKVHDRPVWADDVLVQMGHALEAYIARLNPEDTEVNRQRARVREACLQAAERSPGFFSLTVPTGGGKTLSSLAFALKHAARHGLGRVIYVVPFTSIIEQNADEFRRVMRPLVVSGLPDPVIEHHSNLDPETETTASRLASENWDAPLIVTTGVQFYESLFANRTSRCRKLHNLAGAVIVLDEVQVLPVDFLHPCLRALDELRRNYGATVVLCTATQPAVHRRDGFGIGLELHPDHEIVPEPTRLYTALKRVEVEREETLFDEEL
ncbi:MAG: CRISPR-associated endonuclease Cas3'', partial [Gemmatimonadota bacterium]|nr:CRISPR-associated endonuclease Cas3'' [Gemmatimonadota bacterium]